MSHVQEMSLLVHRQGLEAAQFHDAVNDRLPAERRVDQATRLKRKR